MNLSTYDIKRSKIKQIFISHLHGDHFFGLVGLLTSFALQGRETALDIFCPQGLQEIIDLQINASAGHLGYAVAFHIINPDVYARIFENNSIEVFSLPMTHGIPCCGFLFKEKNHLRNIYKEKIDEFQIDFDSIRAIKAGADFVTSQGETIKNSELSAPAAKSRSYAYCSDTAYNERIVDWVKNVDLLYHEATFLNEEQDIAAQKKHSTTHQAAQIALKAQVGTLLIGHFSARYKVLGIFKTEAESIFKNTQLAIEGTTFEVN